ncbi:hypothetical protein IAQ61_004283 [Plenodomus lingam]|uniref:uncharacterized protein n=1 Tax=Leptosphaeria maculans TaxID=5022 RepID=UPI003333ED1A|nr:hypothetical protein IAQ61_004283 [Plenodomus lingam]
MPPMSNSAESVVASSRECQSPSRLEYRTMLESFPNHDRTMAASLGLSGSRRKLSNEDVRMLQDRSIQCDALHWYVAGYMPTVL